MGLQKRYLDNNKHNSWLKDSRVKVVQEKDLEWGGEEKTRRDITSNNKQMNKENEGDWEVELEREMEKK